MVKLTQEIGNKTLTYSVASISSDNPSVKLFVYFEKTIAIGEEKISSSLEPSPMVLDMSNIVLQDLWRQLEAKILDARQAQLDNPEGSALNPDYQGFLNFLLNGKNGLPADIFVVVQTAVAQAPPAMVGIANLNYSNFSTQLTLAINGFPNVPALQECLNNLLLILPLETDLAELTALFQTYRIPLQIPNG